MSSPVLAVGMTVPPSASMSPAGVASGPMPGQLSAQVSASASAERDFARAMEAARANQPTPDQAVVAHARAHPEKGLGGQVVAKVQGISEQLRAEQKHITNLVERATTTGDESLMLKAQIALADHQSRVQIVTRVTSKAASSMDQLTRLQ